MVLPLLVFYEAGLLIVGHRAMNGADFVTQNILLYGGRTGFIILNVLLVAGFVAAVTHLRKRGTLDWRFFGPLAAESALYALSLGTIVIFVMRKAHLLDVGDPLEGTGVLTRLVVSAGAGMHEELVFRLLMIPAIAAAWRFLPVIGGKASAIPAAVILSSVLFSLAHFMAEPFGWHPFWFRTFAGLGFAMIYALRGFAVAAWTHALYDVYVLVL